MNTIFFSCGIFDFFQFQIADKHIAVLCAVSHDFNVEKQIFLVFRGEFLRDFLPLFSDFHRRFAERIPAVLKSGHDPERNIFRCTFRPEFSGQAEAGVFLQQKFFTGNPPSVAVRIMDFQLFDIPIGNCGQREIPEIRIAVSIVVTRNGIPCCPKMKLRIENQIFPGTAKPRQNECKNCQNSFSVH